MTSAHREILSRGLIAIALAAATLTLLMASAKAADRNSKDESCLPSAVRAALADVRAACGPIKVLSTHRPGARVVARDANGNGLRSVPSLHASCHAVDFRLGNYRCAYAVLRDWPHGLSTDGARMRHIHLSAGGARNEGRFVHHHRARFAPPTTARVDRATQGVLR